jgi:hypothetical protein
MYVVEDETRGFEANQLPGAASDARSVPKETDSDRMRQIKKTGRRPSVGMNSVCIHL